MTVTAESARSGAPRFSCGYRLRISLGLAWLLRWWCYTVDAYARRILGWRVATTMTTAMVLDGIEQATWTRHREGIFDLKDVVHHTDHGQYTSIRFTERLAEAGIQPSVGAVGSSYDKGLASYCTS